MSLSVTRTYRCEACRAEAAVVDSISLPGGWLWLEGKHYCPQHRITLEYARGRLVAVEVQDVNL